MPPVELLRVDVAYCPSRRATGRPLMLTSSLSIIRGRSFIALSSVWDRHDVRYAEGVALSSAACSSGKKGPTTGQPSSIMHVATSMRSTKLRDGSRCHRAAPTGPSRLNTRSASIWVTPSRPLTQQNSSPSSGGGTRLPSRHRSTAGDGLVRWLGAAITHGTEHGCKGSMFGLPRQIAGA